MVLHVHNLKCNVIHIFLVIETLYSMLQSNVHYSNVNNTCFTYSHRLFCTRSCVCLSWEKMNTRLLSAF